MAKTRKFVERFVLSDKDKEDINSCAVALQSALVEFDGSFASWSHLKKEISESRGKVEELLQPHTYELTVSQLLKNYHHGSRAWLHKAVDDWLFPDEQNKNEQSNLKVFWLRADAGMGKSLFTASLICRMRRDHPGRLVGCVFFDFSDSRNSNPAMMLRSLVYQLVETYPELGGFVVEVMSKLKNETENVQYLFDDLLLGCLKILEIRRKEERGAEYCMENMLIVVDALDEAGSENSDGRKKLLNLFSTKLLRRLPAWVKLFVTGRPDPDIVKGSP